MNVSQLPQTFKPCESLDLLKQSIDVVSVQQHVKDKHSTQLQAKNVTVNTLTPKEQKSFGQRNWIRD